MNTYVDEELKSAKALINSKALNEATAILKSILATDKTNSEAYYLYGYIEVLSNNYPLAVSLFKLAFENNPRNANAAYYIGLCEEKLGMLASAMMYYKKTLEINPDHAAALGKVPAATSRQSQQNQQPMAGANGQYNGAQSPQQNTWANIPPSGNQSIQYTQNNTLVERHTFKSRSYRPYTGPVSEFYERLTLDKSFESQHAAQIIKEIEVQVVPRFVDYWLSFIKIWLFPVVVLFVLGILSEIPRLRIRFTDSDIDMMASITLLYWAVAIIYKMILIKQNRYYFSNGNLTIRKGLFSVKVNKYELYRVENIEWGRDILGRTSLILSMMHRSSAIRLRGMGRRSDAEFMCNRLTELVRILRMYSSLKGVIN
ncbi:tetratricopeptide repeat protein [Chitinophaga silvisoli]|uniref:Uncharacterized protein n=1 Tax=Chitinophaga silvisoli TaxID=2291814 RepID=A0A3E1NVH9_9BACT|nr:hypothetical protein [Chitinophaga silvisoli]RFM31854.1 hypothetical protein DXN04_27225 [Chitinophaga silvisoli]